MRLRFLILTVALSALGTSASFAGNKVQIGLYLAENAPPPPNAHLASEGLHHRLHEVFGFKHYELIKEQEIDVRNEWEQWFIPRRDFFIRVEPLRRIDDGPRMIDYEIYKDGFIVAKGRYEPREGTPLFINGPDFHEGRLILVLEPRVRKDEDDD
jgi:hypothetical protein